MEKRTVEALNLIRAFELEDMERRIKKMKKDIEYNSRKEKSILDYLKLHPELNEQELYENDYEENKFNIWFHEREGRKIEVFKSMNKNNEFYYDVVFYENDIAKASIILRKDIDNIIDDFTRLKSELYDNFEGYINLPKLSECSELFKELYEKVKNTNELFYCISLNDWEKNYSNQYSEQNFNDFAEEVMRLHLENHIYFIGQEKYYIYDDYELEELEKYGLLNEVMLEDKYFKVKVFKGLLSAINNDLNLEKNEEISL